MAFNTPTHDTNEGINSLRNAYSAASGYMSPYTSHAASDFDSADDVLHGEYKDLSQYGNPANQFYKMLQQNPEQLLDQALGGYKMSDEAKNQMKFSLGAEQNELSKSGMVGSGDDDALSAEIGNQIYGKDQQQYLHNIEGTTNEMQKFLGDFSKQMNSLQKAFGRMMNMEYGASGRMSGIAERLGSQAGNMYSREPNERNRPMNQLERGIGGGVDLLFNSL